jgi:glycosyltransferase involved in cell wall biosynthesis
VVSANGINSSARTGTTKTASSKLRLAFIGTLLPYKGLDVAVNALRHLPPDRVELHVYGDMESPEAVRSYASRVRTLSTGLPVVFHGRFDTVDIGRVLQNTDVVVVPSIWYENAPVVMLEAFSSRTPVIASNLGGMAELITDGVNGLLFEPGNPAHLARQIFRLLEPNGDKHRLSSAAPQVKSANESAAAYESLFRRAIRQHTTSPRKAMIA